MADEVAGEDLHSLLGSLYDAVEPFVEGIAVAHRTYRADVWTDPAVAVVALSAVDDRHVRVSALPKTPRRERRPWLARVRVS